MKIHLFSPLPPARTDIANFTARVSPALAQKHEITLWPTTPASGRRQERNVRARLPESPEEWREVNHGDISVYQIGNDHRYHGSLIRLVERHAGVITLHDSNLHELILGHWRSLPRGEEVYLQQMLDFYGLNGRAEAQRALDGTLAMSEVVERYPLTEFFLRHSQGVILHNPETLKQLPRETDVPILCAPLAYKPAREFLPVSPRPVARVKREGLRMIVFGFLHSPNRRLTQILEALASFPGRDRCRLTICGEVSDRKGWRRRMDDLGISRLVDLRGFLSDRALDRALDQADLAINLRHPNRGEASGSQLRIWEHALPSLVTPEGWYAHLPPSTAAKVRPTTEEADLHRHWTDYLQDPGKWLAQGLAGRAHLERHHSAESYAESCTRFFEEVVRWRRDRHFLRWAQRVPDFMPGIAPPERDRCLSTLASAGAPQPMARP